MDYKLAIGFAIKKKRMSHKRSSMATEIGGKSLSRTSWGGGMPPTASINQSINQSINVLFKVQSHHRNGLRTLLDNNINTLIKPWKWSHNISG